MANRKMQSLPQLFVTVLSPEGNVLSQHEFAPVDTVSIGRSTESDLSLQDFGTKVSRCHGMLLCDSGRWEYYNVGVNGSYENGQKIDAVSIKPGMCIRLSKHGPILRFNLEGATTPIGTDTEDGAVTEWIGQLKSGDEEAAARIWDRYFDRIVEIARHSLVNSPTRVSDEEDVAVLALKSLLTGIKAGRFPTLDHRDQLWRLLMVITTRKAAATIDRDIRQKRGGGEIRGDSAIEFDPNSDSILKGFDQLEGEHHAPELAALVADETRELLRILPDDVARQIAVMKMEGHTHEEIADKLSCNVRTVERRIKQIREIWSRRLDNND